MFESAHLSMRCNCHPDKLADAASLWHHGLPRIPWVPRTVRVNNWLWLASSDLFCSEDGNRLYEVRGVVWAGARPVPLNLEFAKWSGTQSVVGVSPRGLSWPVGTDRYVRRVMAVLEVIVQNLNSSTRQIEVRRNRVANAELRVGVSESRGQIPERLVVISGTPTEEAGAVHSALPRRRVSELARP